MATFVVTVTDSPDGRVTAIAESRHPALPLLSRGGEVDVVRCSPAQAAGLGMVMWLADNVAQCDWRAIIRDVDF